MTIYVGRWDLLSPEWADGVPIDERDRFEIDGEIKRQISMEGDNFPVIGKYYPFEFEILFNQDLGGRINAQDYWIRII